MNGQILQEIKKNIDLVAQHDSPFGQSLWHALLEMHPADIAQFFSSLDKDDFKTLFLAFPKHIKLVVFEDLSDYLKVFILPHMAEPDRTEALNMLPVDELTDLFDTFSDEELKTYIQLIHKKARGKVLSLLKFDPESAGGIMDTQVLTLLEDYTVQKSITLLQRLRPSRDIHHQIYVTNKTHRLVGYILLEDLVLHSPHSTMASFMRKNPLVVKADEDREAIARKMVHYGLMNVPVVDDENTFLGAIPADTLADILMEEAGEDIQKMSALAPMKQSYFDTPFYQLLYERSCILVALLIAGSFSGSIIRMYEATLGTLLMSFLPMLISTGGNTSSQTSAMVIQGLATGQIMHSTLHRFLRREMIMALMLALILGIVAFVRVYFVTGILLQAITVSCALSIIVTSSVMLGGFIPLMLKRLHIDPAFSAGPFLATLMDIMGVLIFCYISKMLLS